MRANEHSGAVAQATALARTASRACGRIWLGPARYLRLMLQGIIWPRGTLAYEQRESA